LPQGLLLSIMQLNMHGLEKNVRRLLEGRPLLVALDHPQYFGPMPGLINPVTTVELLATTPVKGFVLNRGLFGQLDAQKLWHKILVMRADVLGSKYSPASSSFPVMVEPQEVLILGGDAVLLMFPIGTTNDTDSILRLGHAVSKFHAYAIPVIAEILPPDPSKPSSEIISTGARIAAEIGVDAVKTYYCNGFKEIVESCFIPVLLAGGPKEENFLDIVERAMQEGAAGLIVGRNIFQAPNPIELIQQICEIIKA